MNRAEAIIQQVDGFLVPIFSEDTPDGLTTHLLTQEDVRRVMEGYACGQCLAKFRVYTITCPICGVSRDVAADMRELPQLWADHLKEREREDYGPTRPATFDEAMKERFG